MDEAGFEGRMSFGFLLRCSASRVGKDLAVGARGRHGAGEGCVRGGMVVVGSSWSPGALRAPGRRRVGKDLAGPWGAQKTSPGHVVERPWGSWQGLWPGRPPGSWQGL